MYTKTKVESELIPAGTYEVQIDAMEFKETPTTHRKKISVKYRIRDDVESNGSAKNRIMFDDIWSDKDNDTEYDNRKINILLNTQPNVTEGTEFQTINDVIAMLLGAYLKIKITQKHDTYSDKDVNKIGYYYASEQAPKTLNQPAKGNVPPSFEIDDDDVPF